MSGKQRRMRTTSGHARNFGRRRFGGRKRDTAAADEQVWAAVPLASGLNPRFPLCYMLLQAGDWDSGLGVTRDELQEAGASPELARILTDRLPRRDSSDLTRHPMAAIVLTAFIGTLAWLGVAVTNTQTDVALLQRDVAEIKERQALMGADIAEIKELLLEIRN